MTFRSYLRLLLLVAALAAGAQQPEVRLPSGKLQRDEILKAEHKKSLDDLDELLKKVQSLKADLEKNDYQVLSLESLKKADEIEKLAKRIKSRLRRP